MDQKGFRLETGRPVGRLTASTTQVRGERLKWTWNIPVGNQVRRQVIKMTFDLWHKRLSKRWHHQSRCDHLSKETAFQGEIMSSISVILNFSKRQCPSSQKLDILAESLVGRTGLETQISGRLATSTCKLKTRDEWDNPGDWAEVRKRVKGEA